MGAEISEQDSEKLRKDAFHPGGDAALKGLHKMQKKKNNTCCSCKLERIPLQGPRQGQWGVVCEGDLGGADAAAGPTLAAFVTRLVLPVPPPPPSVSSPPTLG